MCDDDDLSKQLTMETIQIVRRPCLSLHKESRKTQQLKIFSSLYHRLTQKTMATVGGVREVEATANNQEIVNLARFAVDEHNKKQVGT